MFGFLKLVTVVVGPMVNECDGEVFQDHYHPQVIITNRILAFNHKKGTRDYDPAPWTERSHYVNVIEGSTDSWRGHLQRTLPSEAFAQWQADTDWRFECWNCLDDFVNPHRYGWNHRKRMESLTRLRELLGPESFYSGRMPPPIPAYKPEVIGWLQDLWTERTNFQGRKNNRENVNLFQAPTEFSLNYSP